MPDAAQLHHQLADAEQVVSSLTASLARATTADQRARILRRIEQAQARVSKLRQRTIRASRRSLQQRITAPLHPKSVRPSRQAEIRQALGITRPMTEDGHTSFFFDQEGVSRMSALGRTIARLHSKRPLEAEARARSAAHIGYLERLWAVAELDHGDNFVLGAGAATFGYVQRDEAPAETTAEILARLKDSPDLHVGIDGQPLAAFGTIGPTTRDRVDLFEAIERTESKPNDKLALDLDACPHWWERLKTLHGNAPEYLPLRFTRHPKVAEQLIAALDARASGDPARQRVLDLPEESAIDLYEFAWMLRRDQEKEVPLSLEKGRAGRVQYRLIVELPNELSPDRQLMLLRDFTRVFDEKGLPYWAVIHKPGPTNDPRNKHAHIAYYDRPVRRLTEGPHAGEWDFEATDIRTDRYRKTRAHRDHRQSKLREVNHRTWIPMLRARYAKIANQYFEAAGTPRRYDPRTYEAMGIDKTPDRHRGYRKTDEEHSPAPSRPFSGKILRLADVPPEIAGQIATREAEGKTKIEARQRGLAEGGHLPMGLTPFVRQMLAEEDRAELAKAAEEIEDMERRALAAATERTRLTFERNLRMGPHDARLDAATDGLLRAILRADPKANPWIDLPRMTRAQILADTARKMIPPGDLPKGRRRVLKPVARAIDIVESVLADHREAHMRTETDTRRIAEISRDLRHIEEGIAGPETRATVLTDRIAMKGRIARSLAEQTEAMIARELAEEHAREDARAAENTPPPAPAAVPGADAAPSETPPPAVRQPDDADLLNDWFDELDGYGHRVVAPGRTAAPAEPPEFRGLRPVQRDLLADQFADLDQDQRRRIIAHASMLRDRQAAEIALLVRALDAHLPRVRIRPKPDDHGRFLVELDAGITLPDDAARAYRRWRGEPDLVGEITKRRREWGFGRPRRGLER